jgi:hypothetical protein
MRFSGVSTTGAEGVRLVHTDTARPSVLTAPMGVSLLGLTEALMFVTAVGVTRTHHFSFGAHALDTAGTGSTGIARSPAVVRELVPRPVTVALAMICEGVGTTPGAKDEASAA